MPTSSVGTMTPILGGMPGAVSSAYPLPYTLLSLARFARMVGLAPLHFAGASAPSTHPQVFPSGSSCGDVWPRYDWQKNDQVSHESLAYAIKDAEETLAREVGYFPAPMWIAKEEKMYPRDFYRESIYQVRDLRGFPKGLNTRYGKILSGGRRGVTLLGSPTLAAGSLSYHDNDSDGLYETANIQLVGITVTDVCEVKVYFSGHGGEQEWEIRPERAKSISAGSLLMVFDSWLFIDPAELSKFPTDDGFEAVDLSTTSPLVIDVEVYRVYNDTSQSSAVLLWENNTPGVCVCNGVGCPACSNTEQDGCLQVRDPEVGIVVPTPATYGTSWTVASFDVCRAPDKVELYYLAGDQSNEYLRGISCDPLSDQWAWCIIWLAIARLERPPCSCNRLKNMFEYLREDLSHSTTTGSYFQGLELTTNPFGTHRGEMMTWKRVKNHMGRKMSVAVL
jgi:hypothetical protein